MMLRHCWDTRGYRILQLFIRAINQFRLADSTNSDAVGRSICIRPMLDANRCAYANRMLTLRRFVGVFLKYVKLGNEVLHNAIVTNNEWTIFSELCFTFGTYTRTTILIEIL